MKSKVMVWFKAAFVRALKTFGQTFASLITVGYAVKEIDWKYALSCAAVAFVYSIATSIAGLPEVEYEYDLLPEEGGEVDG